MVEMGIFNDLAPFLKPLSKFVKFNNLLLHIRTILLFFPAVFND